MNLSLKWFSKVMNLNLEIQNFNSRLPESTYQCKSEIIFSVQGYLSRKHVISKAFGNLRTYFCIIVLLQIFSNQLQNTQSNTTEIPTQFFQPLKRSF